jgi:hypothetical protein
MIRILLFLFVCNQVCYAQISEFKDPKTLENLRRTANFKKNGVKTIRSFEFQSMADAEAKVRGVLKEIDSLDKNGFLICAKDIVRPGRQVIILQTFDSLGNLKGFKQFFNEKLNNESRYYYDKDQNLISGVYVNSSGKSDSIIEKGRTQIVGNKKITTNEPGALAAKTIEEWDPSKRTYTSTTFAPNGQSFQIIELKTNSKGQVESETYVKTINARVYLSTYTYNSEGLLSEQKSYDRNNLLMWATRKEYDDRGLLVKEIELDSANQVTNVLVYEYVFY